MIVVRVELWSAITHHVTELARVGIANEGVNDSGSRGDYSIKAYRGRSKEQLDKAMRSDSVTHSGEVKNHARLQDHVLHLVSKGLQAAGYGVAKS